MNLERIKKFFVFVGFFFLFSATPLFAADTLAKIKETKQLRVGLEQGFVPFEMKKPNGEWVGFDIEMVTAFASSLGAKPVVVETKWEGIIPSLIAKKFDVLVSGMSITEDRAKVIRFSDPYYKGGLSMLYAKKHDGKVKSPMEFNAPQYSIIVKLGTTADTFVSKNFPKAKLIKLEAESDASNSVLLGKADAAVFDKPYVELFYRKNAGKISAFIEPMAVEEFGLATRKSDATLTNAFNDFLKTWKQSGEHAKLLKKYFVDMPWLKDFPELK